MRVGWRREKRDPGRKREYVIGNEDDEQSHCHPRPHKGTARTEMGYPISRLFYIYAQCVLQ